LGRKTIYRVINSPNPSRGQRSSHDTFEKTFIREISENEELLKTPPLKACHIDTIELIGNAFFLRTLFPFESNISEMLT